MRFELKERGDCHEVFFGQEALFRYLDTEEVTVRVNDRITQHDFPEQMTYLGDVTWVGLPYRYELALYVHRYTQDEFDNLKRELRKKAAELAEKWKEKTV